MKGIPVVIDLLNEVLTAELTAVNQYFLHSRMCRNWGYSRLAEHIYKESIDEMKHADKLIERILLLEGLPNLQDLGKLGIGENVVEGLQADLGAERKARVDLLAGIGACEKATDYVSRHVLREILKETEEHIDWLETQLELVESLGLQNFLQSWV